MGSGSTSQKSDEEDFVKVEDLPLQLTVMCEVNGRVSHMRLGLKKKERNAPFIDGKPLTMHHSVVPPHQEELQKRIVEEQQNNNLSVEILNGNAESLTGLVGSAQALKEPGINRLLAAGGKNLPPASTL